ncbi:spore coat protein GerQ [Bacillus sp. BRMEA1]|uniref:spore coat protein GerQ n=1 Tax=Neobacillus endophyticus TaxID=2738405 RepID=UPI001564B59F|nr:spore coat protein GerQ [Neobacillus endophyticus]NRD77236.1 spore coat protein GerQ [Neobacillus endophyticus]
MSQYYNPQGFQPYTGAAGQQGAQPIAGGQAFQPGFQSFPPPGTGGVPRPPSNAGTQVPGMLPIEQSYIENILRLNKGKLVHLFATFEGSTQWNSKEFVGIIEAAGRDHVILSDPQAGTRYLIPMVSVDYITFAEEIEYEYPYGATPSLGTYPPR